MVEVRNQFLIFVGALVISGVIAGLIGAIIKSRKKRRTPQPYEESSMLHKECTWPYYNNNY